MGSPGWKLTLIMHAQRWIAIKAFTVTRFRLYPYETRMTGGLTQALGSNYLRQSQRRGAKPPEKKAMILKSGDAQIES